jgi:glycine betaine catabolism A
MTGSSVSDLLAQQAPGYTLPQVLHLDPEIYRLELERVWRPAWLFAAHSAELRRPGDRTVFDLADDSVLLVRGEHGEIGAFHNVCRHRGSRLVDGGIASFAGVGVGVGVGVGAAVDVGGRASAGGARPSGAVLPAPARLVSVPPDPFIRCPYHQWAYRFDGSLAACGGMEGVEGFDTAEHGLVPVDCIEFGGLVFVRLSGSTRQQEFPDAEPGIWELRGALAPQGLERAKVAYRQTYVVEAGWKVVWENNRECWHCHAGHPEYIRSHFDTANTRSTEVQQRIAVRTASMLSALGRLPSGDVYDGGGLAAFPSPGCSWSGHRTPLVEGFDTESLDGAPVAPLMGDYRSYEVGVLRMRALPNFWCHASADHAVTTRLAPAGLERTEVVVTWLVDQDAEEGRDYSLERLLPVWSRTSEQDWQLCERNQRGIRSSGYRPGPLSERHEANVAAFHRWYRETMGQPATP